MTAVPAVPERPARILIVDDEENDRQLLQVLLAAEGFIVDAAGSGAEALAIIAREPPDLILLDVRMPDMDGYQVAETIKSNRALVPIPIVMVTVEDDRDTMMRALALGVEDFLVKPVHRDELYMRVRNLLRLKAYGDHQGRYSQLLEREASARTAALIASEQRYRALFESARDAIAVLTREGVVREMNQRWEDIVGVSREQLRGRHIRDFAAPGQETANVESYERMIASNGAVSAPLRIATADGSSLIMEFSHAIIEVAGESLVLAIGRDVTEHRQLEEQLRQAQKLEVIGQLAGGVAHDFNNILTAILGFCDLLLMELGPNDAGRTDVFEIKTAGERAAGLTQQLLAFSRKQILQPSVLDINDAIKGMELMLRRLIPAHIDLVVSLQGEIGAIKIDPTQLEQIVINLVVNAADAMPRGGKLTVETSNVHLDEHYRRRHLPVTPGDHVMLAVSDTGVGMDDVTSRRVFEPFFTTKELGKGTGLGLATVYGIVKQSGGDIWVYSEPGHGSAFKIYLPAVTAQLSSTVKTTTAPETALRGSETILLVEDDEAVRRLARLILERAGYRIVEAKNPRDAVRVADQFGERIDLLLSDLIMPESEGPPLLDRLVPARPDLRVLYISGYADEAVVRHGVIVEGTPFLQKPFTPLALCGKVREVLDDPRSGSERLTGRAPGSRRNENIVSSVLK
ncbi:MAG TPA: response regulator [Polyangia bacterium]|nr:response regulator [Polyangia bacterium]